MARLAVVVSMPEAAVVAVAPVELGAVQTAKLVVHFRAVREVDHAASPAVEGAVVSSGVVAVVAVVAVPAKPATEAAAAAAAASQGRGVLPVTEGAAAVVRESYKAVTRAPS